MPFTRRTRPQVPPTAVHFELGPRSLDPAAVFAARMPSLFETRCRLTTSATATSTCGQPNQRLSFPRRDDGLDHLPFLLAPRRSSLSSGAWRAALRPLLPAPVLVPPGYPGLPSRDAFRSASPPPEFYPVRCIVRIDEHGSEDRVKDASRSACNGVPCLRPVPTLMIA